MRSTGQQPSVNTLLQAQQIKNMVAQHQGNAVTKAQMKKVLVQLLKEVKEQTTFPQMQERIRNAKERRREQQKKSEKLYIDTKKKGVKFYDKKGVGRLKDGKKVYD